MHALLSLKNAYEQAKRTEDVAATEKKIQELREQ